MISGVFHSIESLWVVGVHDEVSMVDGDDGGVGAAVAHRDDGGGDGAAAAHSDVVGFVNGLSFGRKNISCLSLRIYRFTRSSCC